MERRLWVGFDLDGTLAYWTDWETNRFNIGEPISMMQDIVFKHLKDGCYDVKIFTARGTGGEEDEKEQIPLIKAWCKKHFGVELEVTCKKDYCCRYFYDDRAIAVKKNEGLVLP